ncbi:MAG: anaerobic ribonucleoside-triphosphate reductase activating protein [Patescibacteria group bacterium]|nr:anaerobic ribonucleoside-triphosphate reductase activating protein [Patescibacteria group bacterium]
MMIGGLQKFSLLDYPGKIAAIIFTQGCNFRCHFCYNPMLVRPDRAGKLKNSLLEKQQEDHSLIKEDDLFVFLDKRKNKLEAIVITGGEPTLHKDLPEFIEKIKKMGYLVKLDTNGTNPEMLNELIRGGLINYIAMDIKAPRDKYKKVVGVPVDFKKIEKSVKIIKEGGLPHEFRTTAVPGLLNREDIVKIGEIIRGGQNWFLQKFKSETDLVDNKFKNAKPFTDKEMEEMAKIGRKYVKKCEAR